MRYRTPGSHSLYTIVPIQQGKVLYHKSPSAVLYSDDLCAMDIIRSWREQKAMLKMRFPILREEDFAYEEGEKENMLVRLEAKLNKTKTELEALFAELQLY
jgi:hypothetical protein